MAPPNKRKPAPLTRNGLPKIDRLGGAIKTTRRTTKRTPAQIYETKARRRWPNAIFLAAKDGGGRYAVITECGAEIVSLHPTLEQALEVKAHLDQDG